MTIALELLDRCFHGIIPGVVATCARDGTPNISYVSHVYFVDNRHVALSCQFFNKTRQNLDENPQASVQLYDPVDFSCYRLALRLVRCETSGPLFDTMSARIQAIAHHTGMAGVFALRSADVFEVESIERTEGFLEPSGAGEIPPARREILPMNELAGLQRVSERINRAGSLESVLSEALAALDESFGFTHGMVLVPDVSGDRLTVLASRGYDGDGAGAEVRVGEGLIGSVAAQRTLIRLGSVDAALRYGRAMRERIGAGSPSLVAEVPLPGLCDARSQLSIPLLAGGHLVGVLALESRDECTFAAWHEAFLQIVGNQIAMAIDRMSQDDDQPDEVDTPPAPVPRVIDGPQHAFSFYRNDDCIFVDGEYLIRNVPAKILWKLLRAYEADGRTEFSNRELRLDPSLGLPPIKDNLESRLILLRKRLEQKVAGLRIVPTRRGRFALDVNCALELLERDTA